MNRCIHRGMVVGNRLQYVHLFISKCAEWTFANQEWCFLFYSRNKNRNKNTRKINEKNKMKIFSHHCRLEFCRLPDWALLQNCRYKKAYGTGCSQAVPHPNTIPARRCLTSVIRREPVYSSWYGRRQQFVICSSIYKQMRRVDLCKPGIVFLILFTK